MKKIHSIQLNILQKLLFVESLKHSSLTQDEIPNSQLKFHLDSLIKDGLIQKDLNKYSLTASGKEFANRMDVDSKLMKIQTKTTPGLCCTREISDEKEFLIYKRLKNLFFGHEGFPTQKVWWGEEISWAAKNGLKEETNLVANPRLIGIRHYRVYLNQEIVEDKVMYIFLFVNPIGELKGNIEGNFNWIKQSDIQKHISNPLPEFDETFEMISSFDGSITFKEINQFVNNF